MLSTYDMTNSQEIRSIIDAMPALVAYVDRDYAIRFLNQAYADWFQRPLDSLRDRALADVLGEADFAAVRPYMAKALDGHFQKFERTIYLPEQTVRHVIASYVPHRNGAGEVEGFFSLVNDVTELQESRSELQAYRTELEQKVADRTRELSEVNIALHEEVIVRQKAQALLDAEKTIMEMICCGASLQGVVNALCTTVEALSSASFCSILVADKDQRRMLRHGSSRLPSAFAEMIADVPIAHDAGTSGSAAYLRQLVHCADIASDSIWHPHRELALESGVASCTSMPIISAIGRVLGAITLYYPKAQALAPEDQSLLERATHLATVAFERDQVDSQLNYLATHDPLTHLPNRHLFHVNLGRAIAKAQEGNSRFALMFIDLDRFKNINDELGHDSGDELLKHVAKRLTGTVRQQDTVGRLGGDEFTVLLEDIGQAQDAEVIAQKLVSVLSHRFHILDRDLYISCSIGIAIYPDDGLDSQCLLKNSDAAMYAAKELGRNNYQLYAPTMNGGCNVSASMENDLRAAIAHHEFVLHYQPQHDARTNTITSMEALLRWMHPKDGLLMPSQFLSFAETSGLIVDIGKWVLNKACAQNKLWHNTGFHTRVAVNVSEHQIQEADFADFVLQTLLAHDLAPKFLELELTESIVTNYDQRAFDNLGVLKRGGVYITVSDFGTGYSSLSYLKRLPIDSLKIDPSFTQDAVTDQGSASIMSALLALAKSLNLSVTAQGVESEHQFSLLSHQGCHHLQGFAISKPLTAEALTELLAH